MRTDDDTWDLKTGVGVTATMVAAARAEAGKQRDPLVRDPLAAALVREVGIDLFTRIVDGSLTFADIGVPWFPACFGIRGRAFDDFATQASRDGIRQLVILASGLDCRAFRLTWPPGMTVYEVDQPAVIDWKTSTVASLGARSTALHRCVGIDLREDWPTALQDAGFDPTMSTAWIAEGLLIGYLPPAAHDEILSSVTDLSAWRSRIFADCVDIRHPAALSTLLSGLHDSWSKHDPDLQLRSLTFSAPHGDAATYLAERGWTTRTSDLDDLIRTGGRPSPVPTEFPPIAKTQLFLTATLDEARQ